VAKWVLVIRGLVTLAVLLALCAGISGCGAGKRLSRDPSTLVVLELADADTLNPLYSTNYYSTVYESLVFDSLVNIGSDFEPIPALATSWKGTPDGLHWTVELRRGVKFTDGAPFASKDVVWTYRAMLNPDTAFPYRGQFAFIKNVEAEGPYRVHFDLSQTNALFVIQALNAPILPEHILGKTAFKGQRQTGFGEHPVGTGPYVFKQWLHDEQVSFERNPQYWDRPAEIPRIVFRVVLDDQARIDAMESGDADLNDGMNAGSYEILKEAHTNLHLLHVPDLYSYFFYLNFTRPGIPDLAVRRAMMYGWDRQAELKGLTRGDSDLATGIVPEALRTWYDPNVRRYPYEPARARALLETAGYRVGPDGVRRRGRVRLAYTLTFPGSGQASTSAEIATAFQADMRAVGIAVTVQQLDYATFLTQTQDGHYDIAISGWGGVPDPDQLTLLGSDQFPPAGNNDMFYRNPRIDRDVHMGIKLVDPAKRKPFYDDMQRLIADDVPVLFYEFPFSRVAISPRVQFDFEHALPDQYLFLNVNRWRLVR
jgi:peptide/nickel transport system substrate-binding protein